MKLRVYYSANDVPKVYHKHLGKLGLTYGSIRYAFFDDLENPNNEKQLHEVVLITNQEDIPVAWGVMIKGDWCSYKNAMFYTQKAYRRQGLAARIYNSMAQRHKRFSIYPDYKNKKFFESVGRNVRDY